MFRILTLAYALLLIGCAEHSTVERFDLGNGEKLEILAASTWELSQPLYYRVVEGGEEEIPLTFFHSVVHGAPSFELTRSDDEAVAMLVDASEPSIALALFLVGTDESWPGRASHEKGIELLNRMGDGKELSATAPSW